jgi:hypothetical protein
LPSPTSFWLKDGKTSERKLSASFFPIPNVSHYTFVIIKTQWWTRLEQPGIPLCHQDIAHARRLTNRQPHGLQIYRSICMHSEFLKKMISLKTDCFLLNLYLSCILCLRNWRFYPNFRQERIYGLYRKCYGNCQLTLTRRQGAESKAKTIESHSVDY